MGARRDSASWTYFIILNLAMLIPERTQPGERQLNGKSFISDSRVSVLQTCKANFERSFVGVTHHSIGLQNCIRTKGYCSSTGEHSKECCSKCVAHSCLAFSLLETEWYFFASYSISHLHLSDPQISRIQRAARHCQRRRAVSISRTLPIRECAIGKSLDCFCRPIRLCRLDYWPNLL